MGKKKKILGIFYYWPTPPEGDIGEEERLEVDVVIVVDDLADKESVTVDGEDSVTVEEEVDESNPDSEPLDSNSDEVEDTFPRPFPNFGCKRPI